MSEFDKDWGFTCDNCASQVGGGIYDFEESLELRQAEGWINRCLNGVWHSFCCPECYTEYMRNNTKAPTPKKLIKNEK